MSDLLNPQQLQSVEITLRMFEENLRQMATWLDGEEENGILYRRKLTFPADRRQAVRQLMNASLEQIALLARSLDLQVDEKDAAGSIRAGLAESWANLIDSQSGKLTRYGAVDPRVENALDPVILKLAQLAKDLETLFED